MEPGAGAICQVGRRGTTNNRDRHVVATGNEREQRCHPDRANTWESSEDITAANTPAEVRFLTVVAFRIPGYWESIGQQGRFVSHPVLGSVLRRVDETFIPCGLLEEELERRRESGTDEDEPKEIDQLIARALDTADDVSSKVAESAVSLGKSAAKSRALTGSKNGATRRGKKKTPNATS